MAKVLVGDDECVLRMLIHDALDQHEVVEAADGVEALRLALSQLPDLIILDLNMPRLNGIAVLEEVRASPLLATTPVIVLTAAAQAADRAAATAAGADVFLTKPTSLRELVASVDALLEARP